MEPQSNGPARFRPNKRRTYICEETNMNAALGRPAVLVLNVEDLAAKVRE